MNYSPHLVLSISLLALFLEGESGDCEWQVDVLQ